MRNLKRIMFFIAGICLLMACSKSDQFGDNLSPEFAIKKAKWLIREK